MKPAPFEYQRPDTLDEAIDILSSDENARIIAGGQTLVPMMAMRLARPSKLVDVYRIAELSGITRRGQCLSVGATTVQADAERSNLVATDLPLLAAVMPWVGHHPTRARGTIGGSIANADPSAEIPLVAATLQAQLYVKTKDGETAFDADEFYIGPMLTMMPPGACLTRIEFPIWQQQRVGVGFHEVSSRRSDFAFASAAAQLALDDSGQCVAAALGIGGAADFPMRIDAGALVGGDVDDVAIEVMAAEAASQIESFDDLHASATYRLNLARTLAGRALRDARNRANAIGLDT
jgi:CO/xanthine dehydrogenase FAD-binding subunit